MPGNGSVIITALTTSESNTYPTVILGVGFPPRAMPAIRSTMPATATHAHPVGMKKPNPWGLYDIYGNAWEWVSDYYSTHYFPR
jgi:hypothetical protein